MSEFFRKRRNIDLGGKKRDVVTGIQWGNDKAEEDSYEEQYEIAHASETPLREAKASSSEIPSSNRLPHFGDGFQKVTVYLPKELFELLQQQKKMRKIRSYSEAVAAAIRNEFFKNPPQ